MREDLTVIYFTSNREKPEFEHRIQQTLLDTIDGLPVVSVSHKPMDFGTNICVGEHEPTTFNAIRQIQLGAMEAKTPFICLAESDFLYPKEYFDFMPSNINTAYVATPVYILFAQRGKAKVFATKKGNCESVLVAGRECLISAIDKMLYGRDMWGDDPFLYFVHLLKLMNHETFKMSIPAMTFKTDGNMHRKAPIHRDSFCREIPYWGDSASLIRKYMS